MRYPARLKKEGKYMLAEFTDCPGCQTFSERGESIRANASDALVGWLEATMARGGIPSRPSKRVKGRVLWVDVPLALSAKIAIRWARHNAGLTQSELAKRIGVSQQQIARLEHPDYNPTLETLEKVAEALGIHARFETSSQVSDPAE
jgi:ribosome-binding protein aMBF1 (putative translation factor)